MNWIRLRGHCSDAVQEMEKPPHGPIARGLFHRGSILMTTAQEMPGTQDEINATLVRIWQETWELLTTLRKMVGTRLVGQPIPEGAPLSGSVGSDAK